MARELPISLRARAQRQTAIRRGVSPTITTGIIGRERIGQRELQARKQEAERQKQEQETLGRIIVDINAGKIKSIQQIPVRFREAINVTQADLNKISNYFTARKEADLWREAFSLADSVLSSTRPGAIFAIGFSDNPYAAEAYRQLKADFRAYQQRKKAIEDIRSGKTSNVKIIGGRIVDLDTNKFITPAAATAKQFMQTVQKDLPSGEKLLFDKNYKITGIQSAALQKSIILDKKGLEFYNREIQKVPVRFDFKKQAEPFSFKKYVESNVVNSNLNRAISRLDPSKITGKGSFTKAVDVGGGKMQDFTFSYSNGVITSVEAIGKQFPQTQKFKDAQEKLEKEFEEIQEQLPTTTKARKFIEKTRSGWSKDIVSIETRLRQAANRQDLDKLVKLENKVSAGTATAEEIKQRNKLREETGENYQLGSELVGKIIGTSLINMGLGSVDLIKAISKDPKTTLAALPPVVLATLRNDLNVVMSGDPLNIGRLGLEYWTYGKVGQFTGKLAGKTFKVSVGIGRTLSPKYFTGLGRKLLVPPTSLRRVVAKAALRSRLNKIIIASLKNPATLRKFLAYSSKVRKLQNTATRKIGSINKMVRIISARTARVKGIVELKIQKIKIKKEYQKSLKSAKKLRIRSRKKGQLLSFKSPNYKLALENIRELSGAIAEVKANEFIIRYTEKGAKITTKQYRDFVSATKKFYRNQLESTSEYQTMSRLSKQDRVLSVRLIKQGKIKSAKILLNKLLKKIGSIKVVKKFNEFISKILRGKKVVFKKIKAPAKRLREEIDIKVRKYKNKKEIRKELRLARAFRKKFSNRKRWESKIFGNDDYAKLLEFSEEFTKTVATVKARKFIAAWKKSGRKIGLGQEEQFIKRARDFAEKNLKKTVEYKRVKEAARINKPFAIRLRRVGKLENAKALAGKIGVKINKLTIPRKIQAIARKARAIKRKVSPKRIKAKVKRKVSIIQERRRIRKTIKYRMLKARPIRKVTFEQLRKTNNIADANKFIDRLFKEVAARQTIRISKLQYSQLKNVLKKRIRKAIVKGDKAELNKFRIAVRKILEDMNSKSNQPSVRVISSIKPKPKPKPKTADIPTPKPRKRIMTIKDFEPDIPKGNYIEVRVGQNILLQRVEAKLKPLEAKLKPLEVGRLQPLQVGRLRPLEIEQLQVKSLTKTQAKLGSLIQYATLSLVLEALAKYQLQYAILSKLKYAQLYKRLFYGLQADTLILTKVGVKYRIPVATLIKTKIIGAVPKTITRTITKTKPKKKPPVRIRPKVKPRPKPTVKKVVGYDVAVKSKKRFTKRNNTPLSLTDAKDLLAYILDNTPSRTGIIIPLGKVSKLGSIRKNISGYFAKNRRKFRPYKIKKGKKILLAFGYIEKRKYAIDTKGEKRKIHKAIKRKRRLAPKRTKAPKRRKAPKSKPKSKPRKRKKVVKKRR